MTKLSNGCNQSRPDQDRFWVWQSSWSKPTYPITYRLSRHSNGWINFVLIWEQNIFPPPTWERCGVKRSWESCTYERSLFSLYILLGRSLDTRLDLPGETSVPLGREKLFLLSLPHLKLVLYPCRWIWSPAMELMTATFSSPISLRTSQAKQSRFRKPVCILHNLYYVVWQRFLQLM